MFVSPVFFVLFWDDWGNKEISKCKYFVVIPAGTIQIASQGEGVQGLHTLTMTNATAGGAIVQYGQGQDGQQFFVPGNYETILTLYC